MLTSCCHGIETYALFLVHACVANACRVSRWAREDRRACELIGRHGTLRSSFHVLIAHAGAALLMISLLPAAYLNNSSGCLPMMAPSQLPNFAACPRKEGQLGRAVAPQFKEESTECGRSCVASAHSDMMIDRISDPVQTGRPQSDALSPQAACVGL